MASLANAGVVRMRSGHRNLRSITRHCRFCRVLKSTQEFTTKTTSNCRHTVYRICIMCLHTHITTAKNAEIRCPLEPVAKTKGNLACGSLFELYDIRKLLNTNEYSKYLDIYIAAKVVPLEQVLETETAVESARKASKAPTTTFKCVICLETLTAPSRPTEKVTSTCTHDLSVCMPCLRSSIAAAITDVDWLHPTCPECSARLSYSEINKFVDLETLAKYDDRVLLEALSKMPDFRWCLKSGCGSGQLHDGGEDSPIIVCRKCGDRMCFTHNIKWHEGDTCAEFQAKKDSDKIEKASQIHLNKTTKICPNVACGVRVVKISGCDHITCRSCRYEYCWLCFAAYKDIRSRGNHFHKKGCKYYSSY